MNYQLQGFTVKGMILDNDLKEVHIKVDILVGIEGADARFQLNNPNIDFMIKNFDGYDELSAMINEKCTLWVTENFPNT